MNVSQATERYIPDVCSQYEYALLSPIEESITSLNITINMEIADIIDRVNNLLYFMISNFFVLSNNRYIIYIDPTRKNTVCMHIDKNNNSDFRILFLTVRDIKNNPAPRPDLICSRPKLTNAGFIRNIV